ncbi:MAG TPA: CPBP family intramembrane glutamic endopeptidase [Fodinibius sp.]|nr:CPBP family intramembrane glutamic endopeptidase [Fodinibius sp.]
MKKLKQYRGYLLLEAITLFAGIPLLFYWNLVPIPKLAALLIIALVCGYILWPDRILDKSILLGDNTVKLSKSLLLRLVLVSLALVVLVWIIQPRQFLALPSEQPVLWGIVMGIYPILSALPQEIIYRAFFFKRYGDYLPGKYGAIIVSALAFSFLHIVYDNWWAVGLSLVAGLLLGLSYRKTQSLFWVTVEHVLYGWLVFTLGLGNFFYEPF